VKKKKERSKEFHNKVKTEQMIQLVSKLNFLGKKEEAFQLNTSKAATKENL